MLQHEYEIRTITGLKKKKQFGGSPLEDLDEICQAWVAIPTSFGIRKDFAKVYGKEEKYVGQSHRSLKYTPNVLSTQITKQEGKTGVQMNRYGKYRFAYY